MTTSVLLGACTGPTAGSAEAASEASAASAIANARAASRAFVALVLEGPKLLGPFETLDAPACSIPGLEGRGAGPLEGACFVPNEACDDETHDCADALEAPARVAEVRGLRVDTRGPAGSWCGLVLRVNGHGWYATRELDPCAARVAGDDTIDHVADAQGDVHDLVIRTGIVELRAADLGGDASPEWIVVTESSRALANGSASVRSTQRIMRVIGASPAGVPVVRGFDLGLAVETEECPGGSSPGEPRCAKTASSYEVEATFPAPDRVRLALVRSTPERTGAALDGAFVLDGL